RALADDRESRLHPLLVAALEVDDGRVTELLERLRGENRAEPRLAIEDDGGRWIGDRGAHPELQEAATDVRRGLEMAVAVLVGIADVDDAHRVTRCGTALDLPGPLLGHDLASLTAACCQALQ